MYVQSERTTTYNKHVRQPKTNDACSEQMECEIKMASSDTYMYTLWGHEKKGADDIGGKTQYNAVEWKKMLKFFAHQTNIMLYSTNAFFYFFIIQYLADHCTNLRAFEKQLWPRANSPTVKTSNSFSTAQHSWYLHCVTYYIISHDALISVYYSF